MIEAVGLYMGIVISLGSIIASSETVFEYAYKLAST
jgi:hypothetical protein